MGKYVIKRVLTAIPVLFIVVTLVFCLMRIIPGNPVYHMVDENATAEEIEMVKEKYGLNDSIWEQYARYVGGLLTGDWGKSYFNDQPVFKNISAVMEPTILITLFSTLITILVGVPVGVIAATHRNSLLDYSLSSASMVAMTIPSFWLGLMLAYWFGYKLGIFPTQSYMSIGRFGLWKAMYSVALPCISLGLSHVASIARHTRSAMLDVLGQDYIRTARAKGLAGKVVHYKHALKNTLSIVATLVANSIAGMLGGAVVTEKVFNINGMGKLALDSLYRRDYAQEQAIVLFTAIIFIGVNILMDIVYKALDPRIEYD